MSQYCQQLVAIVFESYCVLQLAEITVCTDVCERCLSEIEDTTTLVLACYVCILIYLYSQNGVTFITLDFLV